MGTALHRRVNIAIVRVPVDDAHRCSGSRRALTRVNRPPGYRKLFVASIIPPRRRGTDQFPTVFPNLDERCR